MRDGPGPRPTGSPYAEITRRKKARWDEVITAGTTNYVECGCGTSTVQRDGRLPGELVPSQFPADLLPILHFRRNDAAHLLGCRRTAQIFGHIARWKLRLVPGANTAGDFSHGPMVRCEVAFAAHAVHRRCQQDTGRSRHELLSEQVMNTVQLDIKIVGHPRVTTH